jgi:hypothetical protein
MNVEKEIEKLVGSEMLPISQPRYASQTWEKSTAKVDVPDYIAQSSKAIKEHGYRYAEAIELASKAQFDADRKRHEDTLALAQRIRDNADKESEHVHEWALKTHNANTEIKDTLDRLNGRGVEISSTAAQKQRE